MHREFKPYRFDCRLSETARKGLEEVTSQAEEILTKVEKTTVLELMLRTPERRGVLLNYMMEDQMEIEKGLLKKIVALENAGNVGHVEFSYGSYRLSDEGIQFVLQHPGPSKTEMARHGKYRGEGVPFLTSNGECVLVRYVYYYESTLPQVGMYGNFYTDEKRVDWVDGTMGKCSGYTGSLDRLKKLTEDATIGTPQHEVSVENHKRARLFLDHRDIAEVMAVEDRTKDRDGKPVENPKSVLIIRSSWDTEFCMAQDHFRPAETGA